jgi:hypothetical protein
MPNYKQQIEQQLTMSNWQILEIGTIDEWWLQEYWIIQKVKSNFKEKPFIIFKNDPMQDDYSKNSHVIVIEMHSQFPKDRLENKHLITSLNMVKGKFNLKLNTFITELNKIV